MSKKDKYKNVSNYSSDSDEMMRMLKFLGIVVLILGSFYLIFAIASGEISFGSKKKSTKIQNIEILAGNTFTRSDSSYYVLMYDFDADDSVNYSNLYSIYKSSYNELKVYLVDLSRKFNSKYVVEDKNSVDVSSIDNLKVVNGTLIKIEDGKATAKAIGYDEIKAMFFTSN